ncbi:putative Cyclin-dependent kinase inhibitor 2B-related protein [Paratrimastix pyriformis]|uniref:Cyclin-dependent kinase inhibitor 2B-related protein n=1 Tax=Paratrimastix pyriformis TaxID=342808 RepID=A0ABQ8UI50_9EUKA|nr:putative Cyclin-dependent kinase inhibitor 2B-related protein [Paratrimastix pyriformis]
MATMLWDILPDDIVLLILTFLDPVSICSRVAFLDRRFHELCRCDELWHMLAIGAGFDLSVLPANSLRRLLDPQSFSFRRSYQNQVVSARRWAEGRCRVSKIESHAGSVTALRSCSGFLVSGGESGVVKVWDSATGRCLRILRDIRPSPISAMHVDPSRLIIGCTDGYLKLYTSAQTSWPAMLRAGGDQFPRPMPQPTFAGLAVAATPQHSPKTIETAESPTPPPCFTPAGLGGRQGPTNFHPPALTVRTQFSSICTLDYSPTRDALLVGGGGGGGGAISLFDLSPATEPTPATASRSRSSPDRAPSLGPIRSSRGPQTAGAPQVPRAASESDVDAAAANTADYEADYEAWRTRTEASEEAAELAESLAHSPRDGTAQAFSASSTPSVPRQSSAPISGAATGTPAIIRDSRTRRGCPVADAFWHVPAARDPPAWLRLPQSGHGSLDAPNDGRFTLSLDGARRPQAGTRRRRRLLRAVSPPSLPIPASEAPSVPPASPQAPPLPPLLPWSPLGGPRPSRPTVAASPSPSRRGPTPPALVSSYSMPPLPWSSLVEETDLPAARIPGRTGLPVDSAPARPLQPPGVASPEVAAGVGRETTMAAPQPRRETIPPSLPLPSDLPRSTSPNEGTRGGGRGSTPSSRSQPAERIEDEYDDVCSSVFGGWDDADRGEEEEEEEDGASCDEDGLGGGGDRARRVFGKPRCRRVANLYGHTHVAWDPFEAQGTALSCGQDGHLLHWDVARREVVRDYEQHCPAWTFVRTASQIICGHRDGRLSFWDPRAPDRLMLSHPHRGGIGAMDLCGERLVTGSDDGSLCILDLRHLPSADTAAGGRVGGRAGRGGARGRARAARGPAAAGAGSRSEEQPPPKGPFIRLVGHKERVESILLTDTMGTSIRPCKIAKSEGIYFPRLRGRWQNFPCALLCQAQGDPLMASFTTEGYQEKLRHLTNTQPSIQTLSLWVLYHKRYAATSANVWRDEFMRTSDPKKKLTLLNLANDILQTSRKKTEDFLNAFSKILESCFQHFAQATRRDPGLAASAARILKIWEDRHLYPEHLLTRFSQALTDVHGQGVPAAVPRPGSEYEPELLSPKPEVLPASITKSDNPLVQALVEVDANTVREALANDRVARFPAGLFQGELEDSGQVRAALAALREQRGVLEAGIAQRNRLVGLLSEGLEAQEGALADLTRRLKECAQLIEKALIAQESFSLIPPSAKKPAPTGSPAATPSQPPPSLPPPSEPTPSQRRAPEGPTPSRVPLSPLSDQPAAPGPGPLSADDLADLALLGEEQAPPDSPQTPTELPSVVPPPPSFPPPQPPSPPPPPPATEPPSLAALLAPPGTPQQGPPHPLAGLQYSPTIPGPVPPTPPTGLPTGTGLPSPGGAPHYATLMPGLPPPMPMTMTMGPQTANLAASPGAWFRTQPPGPSGPNPAFAQMMALLQQARQQQPPGGPPMGVLPPPPMGLLGANMGLGLGMGMGLGMSPTTHPQPIAGPQAAMGPSGTLTQQLLALLPPGLAQGPQLATPSPPQPQQPPSQQLSPQQPLPLPGPRPGGVAGPGAEEEILMDCSDEAAAGPRKRVPEGPLPAALDPGKRSRPEPAGLP